MTIEFTPGDIPLSDQLGLLPTSAEDDTAVAMCQCRDRQLSACPGEWEPGCDLGSNPAFVRAAVDDPVERKVGQQAAGTPQR